MVESQQLLLNLFLRNFAFLVSLWRKYFLIINNRKDTHNLISGVTAELCDKEAKKSSFLNITMSHRTFTSKRQEEVSSCKKYINKNNCSPSVKMFLYNSE